MVGVLQKYKATAAISAAGFLGENPLVLANALLHVLRAVLLIAVWRTILEPGASAGGLALGSILTYTLLAHAFGPQLDARTELIADLGRGGLAYRFVRPMSVFGQYTAELFGDWAFRALFIALPTLVLAPVLRVSVAPASPGAAALGVASLVMAVVVALAIDFLWGVVMVRMEQSVWAVHVFRASVAAVLSGALLPLSVYPWGLGDVLQWTPYASTAYAPLNAWVGGPGSAALVVAQFGWAVVLWALLPVAWRRNRQRLVLHGG